METFCVEASRRPLRPLAEMMETSLKSLGDSKGVCSGLATDQEPILSRKPGTLRKLSSERLPCTLACLGQCRGHSRQYQSAGRFSYAAVP